MEPEIEQAYSLAGKLAVVTGAASGIGRAAAELLAAAGARVVLADRDSSRLDTVAKAIGGDAVAIPVDVTDRAQVDGLAETAAALAPIDVWANIAGVITTPREQRGGSDGLAPVHDVSDDAWTNALNWNLNSTFWATRRALPYMLRQRWGRIIAISSIEGKQANKAMVSHYITNRHVINGFVKAVAFEYGSEGIRATPSARVPSRPTSCGPLGARLRPRRASPMSSSSRATPRSR